MRRRPSTLLSAASLLLCLAACALWWRSRDLRWGAAWVVPGGSHRYVLISESSRVRFDRVGPDPFGPPPAADAWTWADDIRDDRWPWEEFFYADAWLVNRWGVAAADGIRLEPRISPNPDVVGAVTLVSATAVAVPYPAVALACAVAPIARAFVGARIRARRRRGLCPACGYDLRASPGRCPECGAEGGGAGVRRA